MAVFSSLKILDFSTLLPGPFATMMFGDMGADVIRVEAPTRWDMTRSRPPFDEGVSAGHSLLSRNKRSFALDLKKPGAVDIVKKLIQEYDIVLEQFRPGVMERLGLGYETLAKENPKLIYCSLTGYGQDGPYRDRAGHDNNYLSIAGVMSHCGRKGVGPVPQGVQVADIGAGSLHSVIGILGAVIQRNETGEGQYIDVSMFDGAMHWNAYAGAHYMASGEIPSYGNMILNGGSQYDYYETSDGRHMSVGSLEPQFWKGLCETLGRPDLIERHALPGPEMDAVRDEIAAEFKKKNFEEWSAIFAEQDCCVEPVLNLEESCEHPQTIAREMVVDVPKPSGNLQKQIGFPIKFSKSKPEFKHTGPDMGQHTGEIMLENGFTAEEIADFKERELFGPPKEKGSD